MCTDAECSVEYYRSGSGSFDINDIGGTSTIKRRVPSFDRTVGRYLNRLLAKLFILFNIIQ